MYVKFFIFLILHIVYSVSSSAAESSVEPVTESNQQVRVADPFVDVHTGPGGGYPVFHVIERGEIIEIIQRRTSWFNIEYKNNIKGWISIEQMIETLSIEGDKTELSNITHEDFIKRHWEVGVMGGSFGDATALTAYAAYLFNKGFTAEFSLSQAIGNDSSSFLYNIGLVMQPFPEWRISPYLHLGTGVINVNPDLSLIQDKDLSNQFSNIGIGARMYLTKQVVFRIEYSEYILFTARIDNDTNEDIKEWKAGFAVFF